MKKLLSALFLVALFSSLGMASVPDPLYCSVSPLLGNPANPASQVCFLAPGPAAGTTITITVKNYLNVAIPNASVVVTFNSEVGTCQSAVHTATTNASGVCNISLRGGGCLSGIVGGAVVTANGIEIRNLQFVRSPDNDSHTASSPTGSVTVGDLTFFAAEFGGTAPAGSNCHDYDNSGSCGVIDLTYFGPSFTAGFACTLNP